MINVLFIGQTTHVVAQTGATLQFCNTQNRYGGWWFLHTTDLQTDLCGSMIKDCKDPSCKVVSKGIYRTDEDNTVKLTCQNYQGTFRGIGVAPLDEAWKEASKSRSSCKLEIKTAAEFSQGQSNSSGEIARSKLTATAISNIAKKFTVRIDGKNTGTGVISRNIGNTYNVITNWHVVQQPGNYTLQTPDGQSYKINYQRVKRIPGLDLAVLEFTSNRKYQISEPGDSDQVTEGTQIYVAGWADPGPAITQRSYQFLSGQISSRLQDPKEGYGLAYTVNALPGMSGGPVLNEEGKVIAINGQAEVDVRTGIASLVLGIPSNTVLRGLKKVFNISYINNQNYSLPLPNRHQNNYGFGLDFSYYCSYKHGSLSEVVSRENNAYGWKCLVSGKDIDIDVNDAYSVIYGNSYHAKLGNFNDSASWYCDTN